MKVIGAQIWRLVPVPLHQSHEQPVLLLMPTGEDIDETSRSIRQLLDSLFRPQVLPMLTCDGLSNIQVSKFLRTPDLPSSDVRKLVNFTTVYRHHRLY